MKIVEVEKVRKVYRTGKIEVAALDGVDLEIEKGRFVGVTGPSGSGKSTLMNLLGGLDTATSGKICVGGKNIAALSRPELALYRRYQVGMIFQSFNIIPSYTALDNVAFPLLFVGVNKKEREQRARRGLEKVGLGDRLGHRPSELSGGEQQRVAIARALINEPEILLADEPTGNLDSKTAGEVLQLLVDLKTDRGLTVVMISHEQGFLGEFSDEVIRLCDGRVVTDGAME